MVRNRAKVLRDKARMVINYQRVNDNTWLNGYKIPTKEILINRIQDKKIFWQIKLDKESIPWTTFSCSEGHFEWIVLPFGLKNAHRYFKEKWTIFLI